MVGQGTSKVLFPLKFFFERSGKWLGLLLLGHELPSSPDHFCWSSLVLQIFMKLLLCLFDGPWFLLFPSTAETSAWWSWRQGSVAKCLCAQTDALYGVYSCKSLLSSLSRSLCHP